jgi:carbonic anhydrase
MSIRLATLLLIAGTTLAVAVATAAGNPPEHDSHEAASTPPAAAPAAKPKAKPAPRQAITLTDEARPAAKPAAKPDAKPDAKTEPKTKPATGEHTAPEGEAAPDEAMPAAAKAPTKEVSAKVTADAAHALLKEGNLRWSSGRTTSPNVDAQRMATLADQGQTPFATVITCSDSRIPVERVFDRGVGDLFVIRVAGNRAGDSETGTVEYGVEHLKTPLLVVMGHSKCGAVAAAASKAQLHGKVAQLVAGIEPAVERARRLNPGADEKELASLAIRENVWQTIFDLYRTSSTVRAMVQKGDVKVVGAVYDIATGKVEFLGEHPWQQELISAMNHKAAAAAAESATASVPAHE